MKKLFYIISITSLIAFLGGSGIYFWYKSFHKKDFMRPIISKLFYDSSRTILLKESFFDFEEDNTSAKFNTSTEKVAAGKKSGRIPAEQEYNGEIIQTFSDIPTFDRLRQVDVTFKIWNENKNDGLIWVMEVVDENGKSLSWESDYPPYTFQKWENVSLHFSIKPELLNEKNRIKMYAWNKNKSFVYIDDMRIQFQSVDPKSEFVFTNTIKPSSFYYDLESDSGLENLESISTDMAHSGKRSSYIDGISIYSVWISKRVADVMNDTIKSLYGSVWLYPLSDDPECALVFEVKNNSNEQKYWNGKSTEKLHLKAGSWQKLNFGFNIAPEDYRKFNPEDRICVYVFNNSHSKIYIDDFDISIGNIKEPSGDTTFVDMNLLKLDAYKFDRYHPPFRLTLLTKQNIYNDDSHFLVKTDSMMIGDIKPHQEILTGNFTGIIHDRDELMVISENAISFFHFCDSKQRFVISGKSTFDNKKYKNSVFKAGDYNGDGKSELLVISKNNSELIGFSAINKNECLDYNSELKSTLIWEGDIGFDYTQILSGNFYGNNNCDLLLIDKTGNWKLIDFADKGWKIISENKSTGIFDGDRSLFAGRFMQDSHDVILNIGYHNNEKSCDLISLTSKSPVKVIAANNDMIQFIFNEHADYFSITKTKNSVSEIFAVNHTGRFSIKNISIDKKGFYVNSISEFSGFHADQNPKYYECSKLIPGKFTGKDFNVLCILYNCADKKYEGGRCYKYDSIPDLPNSIQLYNFSE